jgi:hypothetical protein
MAVYTEVEGSKLSPTSFLYLCARAVVLNSLICHRHVNVGALGHSGLARPAALTYTPSVLF